MDEGAELLRQICAAPEDDAPRLVYADWLIERGDPRGELIHLQCALGRPRHGARMLVYRRRETVVEESIAQLEKREAALLRKWGKTWMAPLRPYIRTWAWQRGFLDNITAVAWMFLTAIEKARDSSPITRLTLNGWQAEHPVALFANVLPSLRVLDMSHNRITGSIARSILTAGLFTPVHTLTLTGNPLGDDGVEPLVELSNLRSLALTKTAITSTGLRRLGPLIERLEELVVSWNQALDSTWPRYLAGARQLRELDCTATNHDDRALALLAELELPALTRLRFTVPPEARGAGFQALRKRFGDGVLGLEQY
jgi:uncharacterized protein (TIGR02996 family)